MHDAPKIDPLTLAVITAAAVAALDRTVRIRKIRLIQERSRSSWTEQGRAAIHASHMTGKSLT